MEKSRARLQQVKRSVAAASTANPLDIQTMPTDTAGNGPRAGNPGRVAKERARVNHDNVEVPGKTPVLKSIIEEDHRRPPAVESHTDRSRAIRPNRKFDAWHVGPRLCHFVAAAVTASGDNHLTAIATFQQAAG